MKKPRTFYRGTDPDWNGPRIQTGDADWDKRLFVSSIRERALEYGPSITVYEAKEEARIVYEGTRAFIRLSKGLFKPGVGRFLPDASKLVRRAEAAGYDAVWFKLQGTVGTVVIRPEAFEAAPEDDLTPPASPSP